MKSLPVSVQSAEGDADHPYLHESTATALETNINHVDLAM